ncbi:MAG: Holliday junction resolvase RuvX [Deltaproteobacteria bacterium]|nr:Holliday junction resolvase RuvX [Deltaproteobacteria bacterium]
MTELSVIALDCGAKHVGVAATDPSGLTAQPLTTLDRKPHAEFLEAIKRIAMERSASLIVLGLPVQTDGTKGREAQRVLSLAHEIRTRLNIQAVTYDERLTTAMASRSMELAELKKTKREKLIHQTSAVIILQGYMANQAKGAPC